MKYIIFIYEYRFLEKPSLNFNIDDAKTSLKIAPAKNNQCTCIFIALYYRKFNDYS